MLKEAIDFTTPKNIFIKHPVLLPGREPVLFCALYAPNMVQFSWAKILVVPLWDD